MCFFLIDSTQIFLNYTLIHLLYSVIGFSYLEAQLPRQSYEQLLDNLKEGVFIVDETSGKL